MAVLIQMWYPAFQMHFNFLEQREALAREVDSISSANCVFKLRQGSISASPKRPSSVHSEGLSSSLPGMLWVQRRAVIFIVHNNVICSEQQTSETSKIEQLSTW